MKTQEIRIGNWVNLIDRRGDVHLPNPLPHQISGISLFEVELNGLNPRSNSSFTVNSCDICGISLTEEIIKRCTKFLACFGAYGEYFKHPVYEGFRLWIEEGVVYVGRKSYDYDYTVCVREKVNTVHQLQNLFFELTGSELDVNFKNL